MIRVWIAPEVDTPEAQHALEMLLVDLGYAHGRASQLDEADLVYAPPSLDVPPRATHLVADVAGWHGRETTWLRMNGSSVPVFSATSDLVADGPGPGPDIVLAAYHLVSGDAEARDPRTPLGAVRGSTCTLNSQHTLAVPPVQELELNLARMLEPRHGPGRPTWPQGKRWAVWLSHDVDRPLRYGRTAVYSVAAAARLLRTRRRHALLLLGSAVAAARPTRNRREDDPYFRFSEWREIEQQVGAHPTYFFGATSPVTRGGHALDVSYSLRDPLIAAALRNLVDTGWEVGLHAGIHADPEAGRYQRECAEIQSVTGTPVHSVRQHYWASHRERPERNARAMRAAGVRLDSSMGMSDAVGWRRGTALPFEIFDRELRHPTGVWEATPTLMDAAAFPMARPRRESCDLVRQVVESVRRVGGTLVLNWHVESLSGRTHGDAGALGLSLIREAADDSSAIWLNGSELMTMWRSRRRELTPLGRLGGGT